MNTIKLSLISLFALSALTGCAEIMGSIQTPAVGTTTTTSALVCPEGYAVDADGKTCVVSSARETEAAVDESANFP
ncbi:MAG: hypothetical protein IPG50_14290 [Myxococcales bacterium]|nr:hypothetical protein [Myxococcales bacterium]